MKPKLPVLALAVASLGVPSLFAQTTLGVGDLSFISAEGDTNGAVADGYSIVTWQSLAAGTVLKFTDNGMSNAAATAANTSEHAWTFTVGASPIAAGTTLSFGYASPTTGKWNGPASGTTSANLPGFTNDGISTSGDQLFVYQGTGTGANLATTPAGAGAFTGTLVSGINFGPTITTDNPDSNQTYAPTSLVNGNAYVNGGNFDNGYYNGVRTGLSNTLYRAATNNITNFTFTNTLNAGYDRTTSFSIASAASIHWDANGGTAGDGGAGTWDATTNDRFKNNATGTTRFRWVNSSAGNSHTAVFGGTAGTVSVASGGVTASGLQFDTTGYLVQSDTITLLGTAPSVNVTTGTSTVTSALAGSNGLSKTGSGALILGGSSSYSGATTITQGSLRLSTGNDRLPVGTVVSLGQAASANLGTLDLDGRNQEIAGLVSVSGTNAGVNTNVVTSGAAATLRINTSVATTHIYGAGSAANSGVIGGAISVDKLGLGIQELGGNNTYAGITRILAGTLIVDGTHTGGGSYTVESGAVLGGNGTISSSIDFMAGALLMFDPGTALTVNGSNVTFDNFGIGNLVGLDSSVGLGTYTLMDGSATFDFAGLANFGEANKASIGGGKFAYFQPGSLQLVVAIPEPSAALLGGLGLLALLRRRR